MDASVKYEISAGGIKILVNVRQVRPSVAARHGVTARNSNPGYVSKFG